MSGVGVTVGVGYWYSPRMGVWRCVWVEGLYFSADAVLPSPQPNLFLHAPCCTTRLVFCRCELCTVRVVLPV